MIDLRFTVKGVRAEKHAAVPTLVFRLRIDEAVGTPVHAMLLRCQIQIEPRRRKYAAAEQERMLDLFGEPGRWRDTLRALKWTHATVAVPGFERGVEVDLPVACTYDFEVAAAKYLHALEDGEVPLLFLFSGTVFAKHGEGYWIEQVPWDKEAAFRFPAANWRNLMNTYFSDCGWIRLRRETMDALHRFQAERALPTWDDALEALLAEKETAA